MSSNNEDREGEISMAAMEEIDKWLRAATLEQLERGAGRLRAAIEGFELAQLETDKDETVLLDWLRFPFPCLTNHFYRNVQGNTLISAEGRAFKATVTQTVLMATGYNFVLPSHIKLGIHIKVFSSANYINKFDWDNTIKALQDGIFEAQKLPLKPPRPRVTDAWIWHGEVDKFVTSKPGGYSLVKLWVLE